MSKKIFYTALALVVCGLIAVASVIWFRSASSRALSELVSVSYTTTEINRYFESPAVQEVKSVDDFYSLINQDNIPLVIKFYATWCSICQSMKLLDVKIAQSFAGKIAVLKVDVDNTLFMPILEQFTLASVPTYLFFKDGDVIKRVSGAMQESEYQKIVTSLIQA